MSIKKVIILRSAGNELANQLWNYSAVYAYALEHHCTLENPAFFEYGEYFRMHTAGVLMRLAFFLPFCNYTKRKFSFKRRLWRKLYTWYVKAQLILHRGQVFSCAPTGMEQVYLPPTNESNEKLSNLEKSKKSVYLDGWLFRNPIGIEKYRKEIKDYFRPRRDVEERVAARITQLRDKYRHIVGVHIRQGDYATWRGGSYLISQSRVREILDQYLVECAHNAEKICFVITSDGLVDASIFSGLTIFVSHDIAVADLYLLASCDMVIGSDSTFGAWASYYGNVPFIVIQKERMDWEYYKDKRRFFENKYSTVVHY